MLKNRFRKTRGFALTEILLVIIILAILMGMIMLTFGSTGDRATATRIMADLDSLRSAVLAYSNEQSWNRDAFDMGATKDAGMVAVVSLTPYLAKETEANFRVVRGENNRLLAGYDDNTRITPGVEKRLANSARRDGLMTRSADVYISGRSIYVYVR